MKRLITALLLIISFAWFGHKPGQQSNVINLSNSLNANWQALIKCKDSGNTGDSLIFGTNPSATNGLDLSLGELELPPLPPSSVFDTRFVFPVTPAISSKKDFRNSSNESIAWRMTFQPSSNGYPMIFSWYPESLPDGRFILKDEVTGTVVNINMKQQSTYTLTNTGLSSLKIEYIKIIAPTLILPLDNSMGIPLAPFLDWNDVTNAISYEIQLSSDQNFANVLYDTTTIGSNAVVPSGKLNHTTYYYWRVRAFNGTDYSDYSTVWKFQTACPLVWQTKIKCTDAGQVSDSLYFGTASSSTSGIDPCTGESELPPYPPTSVYDFRFVLPVPSFTSSKKDFRNSSNTTITWRMKFQPSISGYPLKLTWDSASFPSGNFFLKDEVTGSIINVNMKQQSSINIINTGITSLKILYTQCTTTWESYLRTIDNAGNSTSILWGTAINGTNNIDSCLNEYEFPPPPPSGVIDSRFVLPVSPAIETGTDIRRDTAKALTWRIKFQPGEGGYPLTFKWQKAALPYGYFRLKDEVNGTLINVNMRTHDSCVLTNPGITSLKIEYLFVIDANLSYPSGWNLISVPLLAQDMTLQGLYPGGPSQAFAYNGSYITATTLSNGKGYWFKLDSAKNYTITGTEVPSRTINVTSGWNMIGIFNNSVTPSQITSNPPGIITSNYFYYDNQYFAASTLNRGKGYWVKTTQSGSLTVPAATDVFLSETDINDELRNMAKLSFEDKLGREGDLYITNNLPSGLNFELPPKAPAPIFDVRFSSGCFAEVFNGNNTINLSSAEYPVRIKAHNLLNNNLRIRDGINGKLLDEELKEGIEVNIPENLDNLILAEDNQVPKVYDLSQNYPNPFNPVTTIKYQLPKAGFITMKIYDILGKEIVTLVNQEQKAGFYQTSFNAGKLSSGIYFYRIEAGNYTNVKKMMVIK